MTETTPPAPDASNPLPGRDTEIGNGGDESQREVATAAAVAQPEPMLLTLIFIGINVLVWLAQIVKGVAWTAPSPGALVAWGGNLAALTLTGESWRLFTSMFLHGGIVHLLMNMYMLFLLGPPAERCFGRAGFVGIYLTGGILASLATAVWAGISMPDMALTNGFVVPIPIKLVVSVGASGAIMALCGALLVAAFLAWTEGDNEALFKGVLQTIAINLVSGFFIPVIDQAAHVGGVVAGALLGLGVGARRDEAVVRHLIRVALVTLVVGGAVLLVLDNGDWSAMQHLRERLQYSALPSEAYSAV